MGRAGWPGLPDSRWQREHGNSTTSCCAPTRKGIGEGRKEGQSLYTMILQVLHNIQANN